MSCVLLWNLSTLTKHSSTQIFVNVFVCFEQEQVFTFNLEPIYILIVFQQKFASNYLMFLKSTKQKLSLLKLYASYKYTELQHFRCHSMLLAHLLHLKCILCDLEKQLYTPSDS